MFFAGKYFCFLIFFTMVFLSIADMQLHTKEKIVFLILLMIQHVL